MRGRKGRGIEEQREEGRQRRGNGNDKEREEGSEVATEGRSGKQGGKDKGMVDRS